MIPKAAPEIRLSRGGRLEKRRPPPGHQNSPAYDRASELEKSDRGRSLFSAMRMGAWIATNHIAKHVAPRFRVLRLRSVRRLCSNCLCERGDSWTLIEPATLSRLQFGDSMLAAEPAMRLASKRQASDGSALWWGGTDTPGPPQIVAPGAAAPVMVAISPMRPGHSVAVEYRVNRGPVREAIGVLEPRIHDAKARIFRAVVPGQSDGLVEFLPVLRFAGQPISTRLSEIGRVPSVSGGLRRGAGRDARTAARDGARGQLTESRWRWDAKFLGACTIQLRKEVVGVVPDGFRIIWHFVEARFVGPVLEGRFLPGAADWMRIRPDGVAIVQVQGCIETRAGARIYTFLWRQPRAWPGRLRPRVARRVRSVASVRVRSDLCDG